MHLKIPHIGPALESRWATSPHSHPTPPHPTESLKPLHQNKTYGHPNLHLLHLNRRDTIKYVNILAVYNMQITVPRPTTHPSAHAGFWGAQLEQHAILSLLASVLGGPLFWVSYHLLLPLNGTPRTERLQSSLSPGLYPWLVSGEHYRQRQAICL